jgi:SAM-dependent methyltransferase
MVCKTRHMAESTANAQQAIFWTEVAGPHWVQQQRQFDHMLATFGAESLRVLAAQPGERIIDIGCGTGTSTLTIASAVTATGAAVGFDISSVMVEAATARAVADGVGNASFLVGDAQTDALVAAGSPSFDAVYSRFGVMFFSDPTAAFANIRAAIRAGGRLTFACWRTESANPWIDEPVRVMRGFTPEPVFPPPNAPGPFAFQDAGRVRGILADAGWSDIELRTVDATVTMGAGDGVGPAVAQTMGTTVGQILRQQVDDATYAKVTAAIADLMAEHLVDGAVQFPGSVWVVTARNS